MNHPSPDIYANPDTILPDMRVPSIFDVDFSELHAKGVKHTLIDLDQTLRGAYQPIAPEVVAHLQAQQRGSGIETISIASNTLSDIRQLVTPIEGVRIYQPFPDNGRRIKKPDARFFHRILTDLDAAPAEAAMIGDSYRNDVIGAKKAGLYAVMVAPIGKEYLRDRITAMRSRDQRALRTALTNMGGAEAIFDNSATLIENFEAGLTRAKPYLFELADQLVGDYDTRRWDLLVGDDTSGRLVTRFVRLALKSQGIEIPTVYICASHKTRSSLPSESYTRYVESLAADLQPSPKALVISESAGSGMTLDFIDRQLRQRFGQVDYAIAAVKDERALTVPGRRYVGGHGRLATFAIADTFEIPGKQRPIDATRKIVAEKLPISMMRLIRNHTAISGRPSTPLTNLTAPSVVGVSSETLPTARRTDEAAFRLVARYCYERMGDLATEHMLSRFPMQAATAADRY